jgi:hypothetical protein
MMQNVKYIQAPALAELLRAGPPASAAVTPPLVVVDVRDEDFAGGHIAGMSSRLASVY